MPSLSWRAPEPDLRSLPFMGHGWGSGMTRKQRVGVRMHVRTGEGVVVEEEHPQLGRHQMCPR